MKNVNKYFIIVYIFLSLLGILLSIFCNQIIFNIYILFFILTTGLISIWYNVSLQKSFHKKEKESSVNDHWHNILTIDEVSAIINNTTEEIWIFQISGGHHTRSLVDKYHNWLAKDKNRKLKIMFLNSKNKDLVTAIAITTGRMTYESNDRNTGYFMAFINEINHTINDYNNLRKKFPEQVELRTYDCAPSCSIMACDMNAKEKERQSIIVENYVYGLPWSQRPCFTLNHEHGKIFDIYKDSLKKFFDDAQNYPTS